MSHPRKSLVLMHEHFERAFKLVFAFASYAELGSVCFVTGASGAGKTTLMKMLADELYGDSIPKDHIPVIHLNANNSQQGKFSQKKLIFDIYSALGDPFRSDPAEILPKDVLESANDEIDDVAEWRWTSIVERLARAYGLEVLIIDEGQLMCLAPGRHLPSDYLDALRVLALNAHIRIIIAGTYDLLEVWNYSQHINRRSVTVHINRYNKTRPQRVSFLGVLQGIEEQRDLPRGILTTQAAKLYHWSFGVPGEIYSQVDRARIYCKASGSKGISWDHFEDAKYLPPQLLRLEQEIIVGESILFSSSSERPPEPHQQQKVVSRRRGPRARRPTRSPVGST